MADNPPTTAVISSTPSPFTQLPAELREMIYRYYYESLDTRPVAIRFQDREHGWGRDRSRPGCWIRLRQAGEFELLEPYFGVLQLSSTVRSEVESDIYKAAFTNSWFEFKIDSRVNDVKRMKDIFKRCQDANKDVKLGLEFTVSKCAYSREVFSKFVDFFLNIHGTEDDLKPTFVCCSRNSEKKTLMGSSSTSDSNILYTTKTQHEVHRLWMFGTLARLDWSKFGKRG
jgi:hypothetical protein